MKKPRFPTISKVKYAGGKIVYRINYVDPSDEKRYQRVVGTRKNEAMREATRVYDALIADYFGETSSTIEDISLPSAFEEYFNSKKNRVRDSTFRRYRIYTANFTSFMGEFFSSVQMLSEVRKVQIEEFLQFLEREGQAPGTINAQLRVLRSIFNYALVNDHITKNPTDRIEKFLDPRKSEEVKFWTPSQVETILSEVNPFWRDKYEFLYFTGIREGEIIKLTWNAVDLNEDHPKIKIQASEDWVPKTNERREIPLNIIALEIIKRQTRADDHDYVFKTFEGNMIKAKTIYDNLKSALKRLGLFGSVHTFRHTFASHLVMKGAGIETVSKLLGHSSIEMTMKYAHLAPDHLRKAVGLLVED
ncbi:MAG: tyrosine-type recombinase/integrase [Candidatus Electryoneaceae bacterium]|nr:tyrosine-type recombinase/integrase [Candidatus Electryoneaceae bacterium]